MKSFSKFLIENKGNGGHSSSPTSQETINRLNRMFNLDMEGATKKGEERAKKKLNTKTPTKDGISNSGPTPSTIETNKNKNQSQSDSTNVPTNTNRNPKNKKFNNSSNTNTTNTSTTNTSTTSTGKTFDDFKQKAYSITDKESKRIQNQNRFNNVTTNVTNPNYLEKDPTKTKDYKTPRKYKLPKFITKTKAYQTLQKSLQSPKATKLSKLSTKATPWVNKVALPLNLGLSYNAERDKGRSRMGSAIKALTTTGAYYAGATGGAALMAPVPVPGARIAGGLFGGSTLSSLTSTAFDRIFPSRKNKIATDTKNNNNKKNTTVIPPSNKTQNKKKYVKGGISI